MIGSHATDRSRTTSTCSTRISTIKPTNAAGENEDQQTRRDQRSDEEKWDAVFMGISLYASGDSDRGELIPVISRDINIGGVEK